MGLKLFSYFFCIFLLNFSLYASNEKHCQSHENVDHTNLWPQSSIRQQCDTGSCHSFATISLLEAKHKQLKNEYIDLSERDLFYQHFGAENEKQAKKMIDAHLDMAKRAGRDLGNWVKKLEEKKALNPGWNAVSTLKYFANNYQYHQEGGYVDQDFNLIINNGICEESELPFTWFKNQEEGERALTCLREARKQIIEEVGECKINDQYSLHKVNKLCRDVQEVLEDKGIYQGLITNASKTCLEQRKNVRRFAKSLRFKKREPRIKPEDTRNEFHEYLRCQPIAIDVKNYSNILSGVDRPGHVIHAVVIAGYDCELDQFIVRNSWGAKGYDRVPASKIIDGLQNYYFLHKGSPKAKRGKKCADQKY